MCIRDSNIAGAHSGNVIISNPDLHQKFSKRIAALGISPNSFGLFMATAAYSSEGAEWLERLIKYIDENRIIFDEAINVIPGLKSMPLEGTYLAWVDFQVLGWRKKNSSKGYKKKLISQLIMEALLEQVVKTFFAST